MKGKLLGLAAMAILVLAAGGCYGPNHASRTLDEWGNQLYVDNPWMAQVAHFAGLFTVGHVLAIGVDYMLLNPVDFWGVAAARRVGTPHMYREPLYPGPAPAPAPPVYYGVPTVYP